MEASNVVSAFVVSADQYAQNKNEDNMMQFQRHLEILVCLTSDEKNISFFHIRSFLTSQCITHIVNVLLDNSTKTPLLTRALTILQNLSVNSQLLKQLQYTYHVHSAVSIFLQRYGASAKDALVVQCLQLLESVTNNLKIDYLENHFENLIGLLFNFVSSEASQILNMSLHILSNICRQNFKVQSHVCCLSNFKQIFKKLATIINTEKPNTILYALSILSSITPYNKLGTKLWTEEHLMLTFDLIKKLLTCEDFGCATTAVDLFVDIIQVPKYQTCLIKSSALYRCLRKVSKSLYDTSPKRSELYLIFLNSLTHIPEIKEKLCSILCSSDDVFKQEPGTPVLKIHPKLTLWCVEKNEIPLNISLLSLQLIKTVVETYIERDLSYIEENIKDILVKITDTLCCVSNTNESFKDEYLLVKIAGFDLLNLLCSKDNMKKFISQHINIQSCKSLLDFILKDNSKNNNYNTQVVNLFLLITETISLFGDEIPQCEQFIGELLQDAAAMECLALAITSKNIDQISRGLSLLARRKSEQSFSVLSESLSIRNSKKQNCEQTYDSMSDCLSVRNSKSQPSSLQTCDSVFTSGYCDSYPANSRDVVIRSKYSGSAFDALMNKIENGLQIKDLKSSEIMDMYEHKIAMLTLKEQELQKYVDAKTLALQEADRIITQYKCRQANAEAEALRLRSLMKDFECRCETSSAQLIYEEQKRRKLESELNQAYHKIKDIEQNANEQRELTLTQVNRLSEQKRNIEEEKIKLLDQISLKDQEKKILYAQVQQNEEEIRLKNKALEDLKESKDDLFRILEETKKSNEKLRLNFEQKQTQLQNIIETAQQTIASLEEKNENLANEMAKNLEEYSHKIEDLKSEKEQLSEQLKMRDVKIEDLNDCIKTLNDNLQEKNNIIQGNEVLISKQKLNLDHLESQRTKLKQDKGMLELLCKKYEASIEEKDSQIQKMSHELETLHKEFTETVTDKEGQIQHLKDELEKLKHITEVIHNITSGKGIFPKS